MLELASGVRVEVRLSGDLEVPEPLLESLTFPSDPYELLALTHSPHARYAMLGAVASERQAEQLLLSFHDLGDSLRRYVREQARRRSRAAPPLLVVGWDGADPRVVDDLLAAGHLPNLARIRTKGTFGRLRSHAPFLSPLLWTSMATGKTPEQHGILDFVEVGPDGQNMPVSSACRRVTTLWEIASDLGREVLVVNWWATEPAESVLGEVISDREVREGRLQGFVPSAANVAQVVQQLMPKAARDGAGEDPREQELRQFIAEALTVHGVTLDRLAHRRPQLTMVYYGLVDQAAHLFHQEMPPRQDTVSQHQFERFGGIVIGSYLLLDAMLGELIGQAEPGNIMLVSDHGFVTGPERRRTAGASDLRSDREHAQDGIYAFAGVNFLQRTGGLLDLDEIAPLILATSGIPAANDMAAPVPDGVLAAVPTPVPTHEISLEPPGLDLIEKGICGAVGMKRDEATQEALDRLAALGYLGGSGAEQTPLAPVWPLANLGRSRLDRGDVEGAIAALAEAHERSAGDGTIARLLLEAMLQSPAADPERIEALALKLMSQARTGQGSQAQLPPIGAHGGVAADAAFLLAQLQLRRGAVAEAQQLAEQMPDDSFAGLVTRLLVASWTGRAPVALELAARAAALDPVRTIDTVQALVELFPDRELGVDELVAALANSIPVEQVLRADVSSLTSNPGPTLDRARDDRADPNSVVDALWRRRARAYVESRITRRGTSGDAGRPADPDRGSATR